MDFRLDNMMGFDKLGLYYTVHTAGLDGENFTYSVYFTNLTDDKVKEVSKAICEHLHPYEEKDIYLGYIDISKDDGKVLVYLDLGNVAPNYENTAIHGILKALNEVSGIDRVIVNEDCDF